MIGIENEGAVRTIGALAFLVVRAIRTFRRCTVRALALFGITFVIVVLVDILAIWTIGTLFGAIFRTVSAFSRVAVFTVTHALF